MEQKRRFAWFKASKLLTTFVQRGEKKENYEYALTYDNNNASNNPA